MDADGGAHGPRAADWAVIEVGRGTLASIAGIDPVCGAGLGADTAVMRELGYHAVIAATAIVAQNTRGVRRVWPLSPEQIEAQWRALAEDVPIEGVKIGMLGSAAAARAVGGLMVDFCGPVVLDPVFAGGQDGAELGDDGLVGAVRGSLIGRATVVTPNVSEASALVGWAVEGPEALIEAGRELLSLGAGSVLLKGGHMPALGGDVLLWRALGEVCVRRYPVVRRWPFEVRGTGCHLSSAICAFLARGLSVEEAVARARSYMDVLWAERAVALGGGARVFWHGQGDFGVTE